MAYGNRGFIYLSQGQHDLALEDYNKASSLDPELAMAHHGRGMIHLHDGDQDQASKAFFHACGMGYKSSCDQLVELGGEFSL
jgi:Tfp pilus assembly protein PilF